MTHKLKVGGNDKLELYDYPGGYAQRFDGVDPGGGDRPADLQKIFEDNERTAEHPHAAGGGRGADDRTATSNCRQLTAGHKFTLERHFDADGDYVLTARRAHRPAWRGDYRSGDGDGARSTRTRFTCIPLALPFRPAADDAPAGRAGHADGRRRRPGRARRSSPTSTAG